MPWQAARADVEAVREKFRFSGTPTLVLISAEGTILEVADGIGPKLREAIASLDP